MWCECVICTIYMYIVGDSCGGRWLLTECYLELLSRLYMTAPLYCSLTTGTEQLNFCRMTTLAGCRWPLAQLIRWIWICAARIFVYVLVQVEGNHSIFCFFFLVLSMIIEHCSYAWYANTFVIIGNCPSRATLSIGNIWPKWPQYIRKTTVQQLHVSFSAETEMKITHSHLPRSQKSIKTGYK